MHDKQYVSDRLFILEDLYWSFVNITGFLYNLFTVGEKAMSYKVPQLDRCLKFMAFEGGYFVKSTVIFHFPE